MTADDSHLHSPRRCLIQPSASSVLGTPARLPPLYPPPPKGRPLSKGTWSVPATLEPASRCHRCHRRLAPPPPFASPSRLDGPAPGITSTSLRPSPPPAGGPTWNPSFLRPNSPQTRLQQSSFLESTLVFLFLIFFPIRVIILCFSSIEFLQSLFPGCAHTRDRLRSLPPDEIRSPSLPRIVAPTTARLDSPNPSDFEALILPTATSS